MIKITPASLASTGTSLYGVEMDLCLRNSYDTDNMPTAVLTVNTSGSPVVAGGVTYQTIVFVAVVTYQPNSRSSEVYTKTFAESANVVLPGSPTTIDPTMGTGVVLTATKKSCCGTAKGLNLKSSVSVAYS